MKFGHRSLPGRVRIIEVNRKAYMIEDDWPPKGGPLPSKMWRLVAYHPVRRHAASERKWNR